MKTTIQKTILAGIAGTVIMTIVASLAPMMGLPKMSAPAMLSGMLGFPLSIGWIMHFMIGIMFAIGYVYLFGTKVKIQNLIVKGAIFGFAVFIFAQIVIATMGGITGSMPTPEGGMLPLMIGSIIGHIMYGIPVALIAKQQQ